MLSSHFKFIFFVLFLFLIGCEKPNEIIDNEDLKSNLIQTYIDNARDTNNSVKDRNNNLEKAYGIYSTLKDDTFKVGKIHEISFGYYALKNYDKYKELNEKALKLSGLINDSLNMARSYAYLGIYYRRSELLDIAYENFYESEKIYSKINKEIYDAKEITFDHGKVLIDMARILQRIKAYSESEAITIKAIESFKESENERYLPLSYSNLGIIAKYFEQYEKAIEYHFKAIEYGKKNKKEISQTVTSYNNIGIVYRSEKKYDKAKEYFTLALEFEEFLAKNPATYARLLDNLAHVNFLSNDTSEIPELFFKAFRIRDSIDDKQGMITNALHLAEYYKAQEQDSLSAQYAYMAKDISVEISNNEELLKSYQILSEVLKSDEGVKFAQAHIQLNDSLQKDERLFKDKFARIRYETKEIAEQNQQISRENEILIIAILGLTALFLLGYIIFRQQQSNKELLFAQTQQEANQEIYRLLLNQQIKLEEGRQLEQKRMSEELHDGVLGRLFGVRLSLDGINQRANDGFTEARNKYIDELKFIEKEIRLISHDLGTESLQPDVAYIDAVESLISDLCEANSINFEFTNDENIDWEHIDDQKKVNLFRILQESLQNIFKHASAKTIKINFDYLEDKINLTILDDGIGFKSTKVKKGIGLKNITSRVSQMSGVVQFLSNNNAGTKVSVSVPI